MPRKQIASTIEKKERRPPEITPPVPVSYREIFDALLVPIVLIKKDSHLIAYANPPAVRLIGTSDRHIIGRVCHEFICPAQQGRCPITDLGQRVDGSERLLVKADGSRIPILKTVAPIAMDGGEYLLESFMNLSPLKQAQAAVAEKLDLIGRHLDITGNLVVLVGQDETVTLINRRGCTILEYNEEEILGKNWFDTFLPERIRAGARDVFRRLIAGEHAPETGTVETPVLVRTAHERMIAWRSVVVPDATGTVVGILSSGEEVTAERRRG